MLRIAYILIGALTVAACSGGAAPSTPTTPTPPVTTPAPAPAPTPSATNTITITPSGMTPLELTIAVGQRVTFVNNDVRTHDVVGGVDPSHPECPEILQFLVPGQRNETAVFTTTRTCEYHDHTQLGVPAFQGRIIIR